MTTTTTPSPIRPAHVAAAVALCVMLPALRSIVWGTGSVGVSPASASASVEPVPPARVARSMGTLHGSSYVVELSAGAQGTRYTVRDRAGTLIASNLTAEEASSYFGGQDPRDLVTNQSGPALMTAEDHRSEP